MLVLVTANDFVKIFVGWVRLCYFFIKCMVVNRIGDLGLALSIFGIHVCFGSVDSSIETDLPRNLFDLLKNRFYGPAEISNEVAVALMTSPVHLGLNLQTDDNPAIVLHFGEVQGCHKTRYPNPVLCLVCACN